MQAAHSHPPVAKGFSLFTASMFLLFLFGEKKNYDSSTLCVCWPEKRHKRHGHVSSWPSYEMLVPVMRGCGTGSGP
jgi:hypothetical protein